jgi:hypothetical protein
MYEAFIELTNQIYWDGYAEQLAKENPAQFQSELKDFMNTYQNQDDDRQNLFTGESHH